MASEKRLINVNPAYIQHILAKVPYYAHEIWKFTCMTQRFPTVDAVEVVRCKDCKKRYKPNECPMCILVYGEQHDFTQENGYCDRGERRTDV